jgi:adenine-specific DNA-methyltransferase
MSHVFQSSQQKSYLGQFFTKNEVLRETVHGFIKNNPQNILEPCVGRGDIVEHIISNSNPDKLPNFIMYEIDDSIEPLSCINSGDINYCDFLTSNIGQTFDTIVGNPPFVRTKKGNLYLDFTLKCFELLNPGGELIFIVPSDFFKLTCATNILNKMMNDGTFTHVFHPNNEHLFEDASIDIIVFRYCRDNTIDNKMLFNDTIKYINNTQGVITFSNHDISSYIRIGELYNVYVGIVSGCESVFKHDILGNKIIIGPNGTRENYIFIDEFPTNNKEVNEHMLTHKNKLINRRIRKIGEHNWYEWGALRNIKVMKENEGRKCIYVRNITRKPIVAFTDKVSYFGGGLLMMIPKPGIRVNMEKTIQYLNSPEFIENYTYSGRFRIGHNQLVNSRAMKKCVK